MNSGPRIAAYLGVKDEAEIIEWSIAHLRAIGVDYIMVCDMSSTDGTAEILDKYRSDTFSILTLTNAAIGHKAEEEDNWFSHCLRRYKNAPADWVIFLDADEFWLPASGSLKHCEALLFADVLSVERYNVVLGPDGPLIPTEINPHNYDELLLFAERISNLRLELQKKEELPWIAGEIMPKIMARPSKIEGVTAGTHGVIKAGTQLRTAKPDDLIIAHLGLSCRTRFERKLKNIRAIYEGEGIGVSLPEQSWQNYATAWHWRRWATTSDSKSEFERNITDWRRIGELRRQGVIKSAQEMLARHAT